jgi:Skp family chaperone for outer membrane proteins
MNRLFAIAASLALLLPASADELHIARFDAQRVFDQYQHTKDIQRKIDEKRNVGGPGSFTPSMERRDKLKTRSDKLTEALKMAQAGSPERERIDLQLQITALELELDELRAAIEGAKRDRGLQDESMRQHAELVGEIRSAALRLSKERGYRLLVPDNLPSGLYLPILVSGAGDDLTEALLTRLNEEYAAKKPK